MEAFQRQQREKKLRTARDSAQDAGTTILEPNAQATVRFFASQYPGRHI